MKDLNELLNDELDLRQKEVFELIGKYTKLVEKKEKFLSYYKRGESNLTILRKQKFQNVLLGISDERNERGCGCQFGDVCIIF